MSRRRGVGSKASDGSAFSPEKVADVICRSVKPNEGWSPSKALAKCLSIPYQRLLIVPTPKDDISNVIWTTVLVLVYCATHLVDLHESWYEVADSSTAWLRQQQHFVDQREDLVRSACMLLNVGDPDQLLTTVFTLSAEPVDPAVAEEDAALLREGWQRCYLNEPPYTAYYWNVETNQSTWRHPLETAQLEREQREKEDKRRALLAKILPQRILINRDPPTTTEAQFCSDCTAQGRRRPADVLCLECSSRYFCEDCCDREHCDRIKRGHLTSRLRFKECFGRRGFPIVAPKPRTPFMVYQDQQLKLKEQQQEQPQ